MNRIDLIIMGFKNLFRRKMRTILTVLGIVIGTISIVVMVSLGIGMKQKNKDMMDSIGNVNVITVRPSYDHGNMSRRNGPNLLKDEDIEKFYQIEGIEAITPFMRVGATLKSGRYTARVDLYGIDAKVMENFDYKLDKGRLLNGNDTTSLVFGFDIPFEFRNEKKRNKNMNRYGGDYYGGGYYGEGGKQERKAEVNVLEDRITMTFNPEYNGGSQPDKPKYVRPINVTGVGTLTEEGDWEARRAVFIPIEELKTLKTKADRMNGVRPKKNAGYDTIKVKVKDVKDVKGVLDKIKEMGYQAHGMIEWAEESNKFANIIQLVFGGIGAISLLVAAIGITNTMVMAIYERRKEIGVMKVIGASIRDIKKLFLFEAAAIGCMGGIIGLSLSFLASMGLNVVLKNVMGGPMNPAESSKISIIPVWLALAAVAFTTGIGLISGYLPARKAMKLSALEAIKTE